ncbi:XRE family transcriptional regulator [Scopulibacillus darangshiensis]|uniref:XRE family transcriptional regulator n=1 Tax=Scopulibacillus darangshiensis TaxID=442528 RepID=A0A4R2NTS7_9BACL|nr:cupin domain-containing protein [Scopulibacillus darangshiensis]TCP24961.1 XRE family transcriptional regulator [Scopulibacillus darangshiensis]
MEKSQQKIIGEKIRAIRESKGITINLVAKETGFTSSFISQFERGLTKASIASLQKIASVLKINLAELFEQNDNAIPDQEQSTVVTRKADRRKLAYPDGKAVDFMLTGLGGKLEVTYSQIEPGGGSGELFSHDIAEECIVVLKGDIDITVGEDHYVLYEGDTITFSSRVLHGWKNTGAETCELIWIVTPPTY